jgi:hypothetical protein
MDLNHAPAPEQMQSLAPRVTPQDIEDSIASEHYFTALDGAISAESKYLSGKDFIALSLLTFCVFVLQNGYTVTGQSACVSAENFNAELGKKIAREDAIRKCWPLLGYALQDRLATAGA